MRGGGFYIPLLPLFRWGPVGLKGFRQPTQQWGQTTGLYPLRRASAAPILGYLGCGSGNCTRFYRL